ncbi:cytosine permease [Desulfosporosinus sp. Sb-LF]|uniref:purine-cytosine permease family protein n=1 Tax=Desulfosporosinus sp. Sb-LF TaxID=2560027 RepID=UPI00107F2A36|nr:cytosine permease [Desulfosporosinus sp. Sb-LF]TGE34341.1 purine-cytosine permease-like transporter [Desulfosporosinus sp. Sb-LF]
MSGENLDHKELKEVMEDNALTRVPDSERQGWLSISWNTMGAISTLAQLLIGATCTFIAGIWVGIIAAIIVCILGGTLGALIGHMAYKQGLSNTVMSRFYGFGVKGSVISVICYNLLIIGMLAMENVLIYETILFFFKMPATLTNAIAIYAILTVLWILLSAFGIKLVTKVSSIMLVGFLVIMCYMVFQAAATSGISWGQILTHGPVLPGGDTKSHFIQVINILIGSAGALALADADFGRFSKSTKDVAIAAFLGNIMMDIIILLTGSIIVYAGYATLQKYYMAQGMDIVAAGQAALTNVGGDFVILGGVIGLILMILAQGKVQVLNCYLASLALTNAGDAFGWKPGRFWMIVIANAIGLLLIWGNLIGVLTSWLSLLGILTTSQATIMLADYFIVQKGRDVSTMKAPQFNWAGVVTITAATAISFLLANVIPILFITAVIVSVILYPLLRKNIFKDTSFNESAVNVN